MLDLSAYFDETGSESDINIKIAGMGGCLAPAYHWECFESEWRRILDGVEVEYFHMNEFAHSVGQFKNKWPGQAERDTFYTRLWDIIEKVNPRFIGCFVPLQEYRSLLNKTERESLDDVYFVTYQSCLGAVFEHFFTQIDYTRSISMIFDDKKGFKGRAFEYYDFLMQMSKGYPDNKISRPEFRNMREALPLQTADIVAYESSKEYARRLYSPQYSPRAGFRRMQAIIETQVGFSVELGGSNTPIIFHPAEHISALADALRAGD